MDSLLLRRVQTGLLVRQGIIEPVMPRRILNLFGHDAPGRLTRQLLRRFLRRLRGIEPHRPAAERQFVQRGVIQLALRQRGKNRGAVAHRAARRLHPALTHLRGGKRTVAGGQDHVRLTPRQADDEPRLPERLNGHRIASPEPRPLRLTQHCQTVAFGHLQRAGAVQRPAAVEFRQAGHPRLTLGVAQRQAVVAARHAVNDKAFPAALFGIPALHDHPLPVVVAHLLMAAVEPDRLQRGDTDLPLAQHLFRLKRLADYACEHRLLARTGDLRHAVFTCADASGKVSGQAVIPLPPVRLADNRDLRLLTALPRERAHSRFLHDGEGAAGPGALAAVGNQQLDVMAQRTVEQRERFFQGQLLPLVHNQRAAGRKGHALRQPPPVGDMLAAEALILHKGAARTPVGGDNLHVTPLFARHHRQFRHALTLTGRPALTRNDRHGRTVLGQNAHGITV